MKQHSTAVIDPRAQLAPDVEVSPYCVIGPDVEIGPGCWIERKDSFDRYRSTRDPGLVLGANVRVHTWTVFNVDPTGEIVVGDDCVLVGATFMCAERITLGRGVIVSYHVTIADSDFPKVELVECASTTKAAELAAATSDAAALGGALAADLHRLPVLERSVQDSATNTTRFLVITHHPMTMMRMNRLFGVTMAERGISQLVSVDLETAKSFREAV